MCRFRKKNVKTLHFGHFGPIVDHFRWKSENVTFLLIFFIIQYKQSENSNARIFGKMVTNVRMYEQAEVNPKVYCLRRETKKHKNLNFLSFWTKTANFGQIFLKW